MRNPLTFEWHVLYATTILDTCLGLQKNCHEHQRPSPLGSADALHVIVIVIVIITLPLGLSAFEQR